MAYTPQTTLGTAVDGILDRVIALQRLALPASTNAVPYPFYVQDSWPYWTNQPGGLVPSTPHDQRAGDYAFSVEMRLVFGHITSNFEGQLQVNHSLAIADVTAFFVRYDHLAVPDADDVALRTPPRWLAPTGIRIQAGMFDFFQVGPAVLQAFVSFTLHTPLNVNVG